MRPMNNMKQMFEVNIRIVESGCFEVEASSEEEAKSLIEDKIAAGDVFWGDMDVVEASVKPVDEEVL